jgi:hypothetical protein
MSTGETFNLTVCKRMLLLVNRMGAMAFSNLYKMAETLGEEYSGPRGMGEVVSRVRMVPSATFARFVMALDGVGWDGRPV